jgi:murein DD-endopeptidase MepM/ murein hydrolase activator NlpD
MVQGGFIMFWDKPWRKKKANNYNSNPQKNRGYSFDWSTYSRPGENKWQSGWDAERRPKKRSTAYKLLVALSIFILLVAVRQWESPVGEEVRTGLRYVLTTDWNFQPVVEKVVQLGLQLTGGENHFDSGIPREMAYKETMGTSVSGSLPLPLSGKLVRGYGWTIDPLDNMERFHPGIDIAAAPGSQVKAVLAGKVFRIGDDGTLGRFVQINHGEGTYTLYAGLADIRVTGGQQVKAGEVIGEVSGKGDVAGGGLHFEIREENSLVDPVAKMELPPVK